VAKTINCLSLRVALQFDKLLLGLVHVLSTFHNFSGYHYIAKEVFGS